MSSAQPSPRPSPQRLRVAALRTNAPTRFDLRPDEAARTELAEALGLLSLRKLRLAGALHPEGRDGWRLEAELGATIAQPCVVTLDPVTTRIDEPVERLWLPAEDLRQPGEGSETEVPEDDADPLPDWIDLREVLTEALSLALPQYPHAAHAEQAAPESDPEAQEEDEERPNPFAALAGLRDQLSPTDEVSPADDGKNGGTEADNDNG